MSGRKGAASLAPGQDAGSVFLALQLIMIYLPPSEPVVLGSPLSEEWYVSQGGHAELVNYHYVTSAQRDSLDIVQIVDGRSHPIGNTDLDSYHIFGAQLRGPTDGIVTSVVDGLADQQIGSVDREHEAGTTLSWRSPMASTFCSPTSARAASRWQSGIVWQRGRPLPK